MKQHFKLLIIAGFFIIFGYFVNTILFIFLAKSPVEYVNLEKDINFFNVSIEHLFYKKEVVKVKKLPKKIITASIKDFTLKAIYGSGKGGFIIIDDKGKSVFINYGDVYKGYKLTEINIASAVFQKNNKNYIISFKKTDIAKNSPKVNQIDVNNKENTNNSDTKSYKRMDKIQKAIIKIYSKNIHLIWSNIGINKVEDGYKITYIRPGSIFDRLGLKKGDILTEVNGRKLQSDADVWNLYKNRLKFKSYRIQIIRDYEKKVLNYEVY